MLNADRCFYIALAQSRLPSLVLNRLVQMLGSAQAVWEASVDEIKPCLSGENYQESQWTRFEQTRNTVDPHVSGQLYEQAGIHALIPPEVDYPEPLREIHDPPFVLFVQGNSAVLSGRMLAVVGTRRYTDYGERLVHHLLSDLSSYQPTLVSGLAAGIDTLAHKAALTGGYPTVAVFGTGLDKVFPSENNNLAKQIIASGGALVSEYPLGVSGDKYTFPRRNRIIAGLCQGTLIIEGDYKSGAMITARQALRENREVMAPPGMVFSPTAQGPNQLIQQGATLVQSASDIAHTMGWVAQSDEGEESSTARTLHYQRPAVTQSMSRVEQDVYAVIGFEPTPFEVIHRKNHCYSVLEINQTLTMLELQGVVNSLAGSMYSRV